MTPEARELMMNWIADHGADHDDDCPGDDTCSCSMKPNSDAINACCVFLHNAPARIRELEAAIAERDEAVKLLGKAFYGMWGELKDHDATTQTLEDIDAALANPLARAAVDAAKGGEK